MCVRYRKNANALDSMTRRQWWKGFFECTHTVQVHHSLSLSGPPTDRYVFAFWTRITDVRWENYDHTRKAFVIMCVILALLHNQKYTVVLVLQYLRNKNLTLEVHHLWKKLALKGLKVLSGQTQGIHIIMYLNKQEFPTSKATKRLERQDVIRFSSVL